jgi:hypothetical protein
MNLSNMHGIVLGRTVSRLPARLLFAIIAAQACGTRTGLNEGLASDTGGLPAIGGATASGGSPFNGGSSTTVAAACPRNNPQVGDPCATPGLYCQYDNTLCLVAYTCAASGQFEWSGHCSLAVGGAASTGGTTSTGGAPGTPMTTGIGGTSSSPATPRTGGATSSGLTTGGQPGCEYQGRWYPAGAFWESGDGCGCTGISMDGGVTVMRVCTEHYCYSNGFVSIAGVGNYCVVEADASLD